MYGVYISTEEHGNVIVKKFETENEADLYRIDLQQETKSVLITKEIKWGF